MYIAFVNYCANIFLNKDYTFQQTVSRVEALYLYYFVKKDRRKKFN